MRLEDNKDNGGVGGRERAASRLNIAGERSDEPFELCRIG